MTDTPNRRERILAWLYPDGDQNIGADRLGEVCAAVTGMTRRG